MTADRVQALRDAWTPDRIGALRGRLRMNQEPFARALGYSHASRVSELEAGDRAVTASVALLLEYLDRHGPLDFGADSSADLRA